MTDNDDLLMPFQDEHDEPSVDGFVDLPWKILIVDDDVDVHQATEYALADVNILGRRLQFLHAYTSLQAFEVLFDEPEVAVILLDVVMESEDAGLVAIGVIRRDMALSQPRIILRTGQPGYAPELSTIQNYDINDYRTKSELTRIKLYTALTAAIRSYDQLRRLESSRKNLQQILHSSNQFLVEPGLQEFSNALLAEIAAFLDAPSSGLICSRLPKIAGSAYAVSAATGKMVAHKGRLISAIDDESIRNTVQHCLEVRKTLIEPHAVTLFFPGRRQEFCAYVEIDLGSRELDRQMIEVFCANVALCGENTELVEELRNFAFTDPLVALPNRSFFTKLLDERLDAGNRADLTIALVDVDQFAEANDMFGYRYGDQLLKAIAQRLSAAFTPECVIARIANDTFGVLGSTSRVRPETLQAVFQAPFDIDGIDHPVSVSLGFVAADQNSGNGSDLLKDASIAIKRAKVTGQGQFAYYTPEVGLETRDRTRLLHDLRVAFKQEALSVFYQPQIDLNSNQVVGVEALVRWRLEDGSFIPPDRFIPVAEQSGLIVELGKWVLHTSLKAVMQMRAAGATEIRVAVNVSPTQFRQPNFLAIVDDALRLHSAPADALELEVTESVAIVGMEYVEQVLIAFRERNIAVAIDDFGTGYSSLSYLDQIPVDRLKIDRAFVTALDSGKSGARIAELVIPLGHQLKMKVLAEGIETEQQLDQLRRGGCDEGQGYYFARPMALPDLLVWLKKPRT